VIEKEVLLPLGAVLKSLQTGQSPLRRRAARLQDCKTKKPASAVFFSSSLAAHNAYAGARATYDYLVFQETHYR
jgi:hypothetical protein